MSRPRGAGPLPGALEIEAVTRAVEGVPYMTPEQGHRVYHHIRATRPERVLEIGTGYGVSAAYMAAALEANGAGLVVSVDHVESGQAFPPAETLRAAGLEHRVTLVRVQDSSYNWYLKRQIEEQSDAAGNCAPLYDFCYLDGAHHWTIDGFTAILVEKLLRPGGWVLLDDLDWTFGDESAPTDEVSFPMSAEERSAPHMRSVFDLVVKQHPSFSEFRIEDERWGWARKAPGEPRRLTIETTRSLGALVAAELRRLRARIGRRRRRTLT